MMPYTFLYFNEKMITKEALSFFFYNTICYYSKKLNRNENFEAFDMDSYAHIMNQ